MAYLATAVCGLLIGLAAGWFGHRRVFTWCVRCTRPVGSVCADCRDRERAGNLRHNNIRKVA
jgi:hypothetical protein